MSVPSKEKYERLKKLPEEYRSEQQREEIIDFIYTDIQVPTRKTLKRSLNNKSVRNSVAVANPNPQYKIENEINNNISQARIPNGNTSGYANG